LPLARVARPLGALLLDLLLVLGWLAEFDALDADDALGVARRGPSWAA